MEVNDLLKLFCADNQIVELENWIKKSEGNLNVTDAEGSLRAILLSAIYKNNAKREATCNKISTLTLLLSIPSKLENIIKCPLLEIGNISPTP